MKSSSVVLFLTTLPKYEIHVIAESFLSQSGPMKLICVFPCDVSFADQNMKFRINWFTVTEACKEGLIDAQQILVYTANVK